MQEATLLAAWDDLGTTFGPTEGQSDVVAQVVPMPLPPVTPVCTGITFDSDPHNCGLCGHDCLGGTCQSGQCQPFALATGMPSPMGGVVVGTDLYVSDFGALGPPHIPGSLLRIAADGTKTTLETDLSAPAAVWFDQTTSSLLMTDYSHFHVISRP